MVDDIRIVLSDVDGVWTDRKIYIGEDGCHLRAYSTEDSIGVVLLKIMQLPLVILTGEDNNSLKHRMERLKVAHIYTGVRNKLYIAEQALKKFDLTLSQAAFVGDDLNDLPLIRAAGFSAVPANAMQLLKENAALTLTKTSGNGVFREFCEEIARKKGIFNQVIDEYTRNITKFTY